MRNTTSCALVTPLVFCVTQIASAADPISSLPLPEMVVAKTADPPTIDGRIESGEWDAAPAATAFMPAFKNELSHIQTVAWVTYDDTHIYVCMKNYRGPTYSLLKKRGRQPDEDAIVFDTSNEIWITPPASPAETYQTLFNTYPGVFDVKMIPSVGYNAKSWNGNWQIAASETSDHWIIEARAPITSFGHERIRNGDTWRALFTTDALGGAGFTAWAPGGAFAEINRHGFLRLQENSAVFQFLDVQNIFTGKATLSMAVTGPARGKSNVEVTARFGPKVDSQTGDIVLRRRVAVADGQHEAFALSADLTKLDLPRVKDVPRGYCEVKAVADGRTVLSCQIFPFSLDGYERTPPVDIISNPYDKPIGVEGKYAPLNKKLIVRIDRLYFEQRKQATKGNAQLIDPKTKKTVAERPVAPFYRDYSQFPMDLAHVQVPIETEEVWQRNRPALEENKRIQKDNKEREKQGKPPLPLKRLPLEPAEYLLRVTLTDEAGDRLVQTDKPVKLKGYQFEWLPNSVGVSDAAIPPWTPVKWNGRDTVEMWNKRYRFNSLGLATQITNGGQRQLASSMRMVAVADGKDVAVCTGDLGLTKIKEAYLELMGFAEAPGMKIKVDSRVEMDGCVLNTMRLTPTGDESIERLSMVVAMPKSEAECFVTTSGGWSSTFGWTPKQWDSRETSSGALAGNFVPFVFLTDSDRGFCWFADSEQGWLLDPDEPTVELESDEDAVTLRVNFITRRGPLTEPTTIRYGWMVTPQKPQPKGWRGWKIDYARPFPETNVAFYGMEQTNWAVLWPYYASPYPWDYEKSKKAFDRAREHDVVLAAGNIAHAIARYRDYKDRWFTEVAADWGMEPGNLANGNVALSRGPNDFRLWHWDRWIRESGLNGLYFDETYLNLDRNYLTGGAYLLPDERVQPGYNFLGLREMCKRLRYLFHRHRLDGPRLWFHTSANHPVYAWMPDIAMEAENVEPTGLDNDYLNCLPASRLRAIGMGRNLGTVPLVMCQADRHWDDGFSPFCVPQMIGWVLAHDCLPENSAFWDVLAVESKIALDEVTFRPYWEDGLGIKSSTKDILVSAHTRAGHALLWIVNTSRSNRRAEVSLDLRKVGLNPSDRNQPLRVIDAETGESVKLSVAPSGEGRLAVDVPARFWRAVRIVQPRRLQPHLTFVASFDAGTAKADEAMGYDGPYRWSHGIFADLKRGFGVSVTRPLSYLARHHVTKDSGRIEFRLYFDPAKARGTLLAIDRLKLAADRGRLRITNDKTVLSETELELPEGPTWHPVSVTWQKNDLQIRIGSQAILKVHISGEMPIKQQARGLEIRGGRKRAKMALVTVGPLTDAVIDDLVMGK